YFHSKADSFDINKARMMFLDRVYPVLREQRKGYQRLFIRDGNENAFYEDVGHNGMITLPPGSYQVKIEAADYFGNRSVASGQLRMVESKLSMPERIDSSSSGFKMPIQSKGLPKGYKNLIWTNDWIANASSNHSQKIELQSPGSFSNERYQFNFSDQSAAINLRN